MNYEEFIARYPDMPKVEPIKVLNLIMQRVWAEKIVSGEKKVEYRDFSDFYVGKLIDKKMTDWIDKHEKDQNVMMQIGNFVDAKRKVETIHFSNYNKSWYLDVEVDKVGILKIDRLGIKKMHEEYNNHEWDELLEETERDIREGKLKQSERPRFFYFGIKRIISTDLC